MKKPINIFGELSLLSGSGLEISIKADERIIELEMVKIRDGFSLAKRFSDRRQRRKNLERLQTLLAMADLIVHIRVAKRLVGLLTPHSHPTLLAKFFGVAPVELKPLALILVLLRL